MIEQKLKEYEEKGLCGKTTFIKRISPHFIEKARHNLTLCSVVWELSNENQMKKGFNLPETFTAFDWVVVIGYYSMYHSALAALASIGYKSSNHTATVIALEVHFVKKNLLEREFLEKLKQARELEEEYIQKLRRAKRRREIAQYGVTKKIGKEMAKRLVNDAGEFVDRMEKLIQKKDER